MSALAFSSGVIFSQRRIGMNNNLKCKRRPRRHQTSGMPWCSASMPVPLSAQADEGEGESPEELTYAASGVDIDMEAASVRALVSALGRPSRKPGTLGGGVPHSGGFSGLIEFGDNLLALCTDGIGSKLLLAGAANEYTTIAHDCVAMNVNDLLCVGAEPLAFVDYIAAPAPSPSTWRALGASLGAACRVARVTLCGGETASLPDMVSHIDMSGTALGVVPRGLQIDGSGVKPGDRIIGLPASGVHSNGFSLVRRVLDKSGLSLSDAAPFAIADDVRASPVARFGNGPYDDSVTLGEVLLTPTQIYVDPIVDLLQVARDSQSSFPYADIVGLVHVTGGGLSNLLRLQKGVGFEIDSPLEVLPEFEWLQSVGEVSDFEMFRTFNMGMGMCVVVRESSAVDVLQWVQGRMPRAQIVGRVTDSGVVVHSGVGVSYDTY